MHLVIDQGNSFTKIGLFEDRDLIRAERLNDAELEVFLQSDEVKSATACFYSTVRATAQSILFAIPQAREMNTTLALPFAMGYATPQTLGTDRTADVAGAMSLYPNQNLLVIDLGTCITYNVVVEDKFVGGAISPGISSRLRAMHDYTGKLPLIETFSLPETNAKSTHDSLLNGAVRGTLAELEGMIHFFCSENGPLSVIVTGGDASFLAEHLESPIFAVPFLTLIGLNEIFLLNSN